MKADIQHKFNTLLEFLPFPVTGSVSRLLMMVETAGRVEFKFK